MLLFFVALHIYCVQTQSAHLQGQLAESHGVLVNTKTELEAAVNLRRLADEEKKVAVAEKKMADIRCLEAHEQMASLRTELQNAKVMS